MKGRAIRQIAACAIVTVSIIGSSLMSSPVKEMNLFGATPVYAAEVQQQQITVVVDGQRVTFPDQQPIIQNNRTLVPLRGVLEFMGFQVDYDEVNRAAMLKKGNTMFFMPIDKDRFLIREPGQPDRLSDQMDVPAQIFNNRTLVPLRVIAETSGARVDWIPETWTAVITTGVGTTVTPTVPVTPAPVTPVTPVTPAPVEQQVSDPVFDEGFSGELGVSFIFDTLSFNDKTPLLKGSLIPRNNEKYRDYEVKWDLSQTDPRLNYRIYDGEGASTNVLADWTEYRPVFGDGTATRFTIGDTVGLSTSADEAVYGLTIGQTITVKVSLRNTKTGGVASWVITFPFKDPETKGPGSSYVISNQEIQYTTDELVTDIVRVE